jgi:hypothetical protein
MRPSAAPVLTRKNNKSTQSNNKSDSDTLDLKQAKALVDELAS